MLGFIYNNPTFSFPLILAKYRNICDHFVADIFFKTNQVYTDARMAESVDALVSNTNDCNDRAGSTPAPGTKKPRLKYQKSL